MSKSKNGKAKAKRSATKAKSKRSAKSARSAKSKRSAKSAKGKPGRKPGHYKPASERRETVVAVKVTAGEAKAIVAKAKRLAGGSMSRFLRHAAECCKTKAPTPDAA